MEFVTGDYSEYLSKTEQEIEVLAEDPGNNDAKFYIGMLEFEGLEPERIKPNEAKGFNWLKEAANNGQYDAQEYLAYHEIKFSKVPNIKKIMGYLENVTEHTDSIRACASLAEFHLSQENAKGATKAFKLYEKCAQQNDHIGLYWVGCLYYEGRGVEKDVEMAVLSLEKASELGNCQADHQLFIIFSENPETKDLPRAYNHLLDAMENGVTAFTDIKKFFKENI
jgi:TPR repeat protein